MTDRRIIAALVGLMLAAVAAGGAGARAPLAASDWLSGSTRGPVRESSGWRPDAAVPPDAQARRPKAPPVARSGVVGAVSVSRLNGTDADAAGVIAPGKAGLAPDMWQGSGVRDLAARIAATPARLPVAQDLLRRLLLARLDPPAHEAAEDGLFAQARIDRLLDMGDLDGARALLDASGAQGAALFRRAFDVALLSGDESRACAAMETTPGIAPSFAARIFCLAQTGDWAAAALVYRGALAQGLIAPDRVALLAQFLDDSYVDAEGQGLTPPDPVTPLDFRLFEAVGQPLPTGPLPLAFAHADLDGTAGWKARLEAAERLARSGALPADRLRAAYAGQSPAASGGVWDRAAAAQALQRGDWAALPDALAVFARADLGGVLAAMFAADVPADAPAPAALLRQWGGLADARAALPAPATAPEGARGAALLGALADLDAGLDGDAHRARRGLAMLRALGLEAEARLAATQLMFAPQMRAPR